MDQPTNLEITICGKIEAVQRAALAAQRRIHLDTSGFKESAYAFDASSNFMQKIDAAIGMLGDFTYQDHEDGTAKLTTRQESYGCILEEDITGIANAIVEASPDVEAHIAAVITITYTEGYDLCVDIDYVDGEMSVRVTEDEYNAEEKDQIRKILDAIGEEHGKELADEMLNELFEEEWTELHDDVLEAFFDAGLSYADDIDDFISEMTAKVNELFEIVIDDDMDEDDE